MAFKDLENAIKDASQKYYTDGTSPLSDKEFDSMLDELQKEDPENELLTAVGHGYDVDEYAMKTGKKKVKHKYGIVGSLEKAYNWGELKKELKNVTLDVSLKLDGISCALYYENGKFYQALTRGVNGYGIDITDKVKHILEPSEQELEDDTFTGSVRGEICMPEPMFKEYLETIDKDAKNSRNTTAGLINSKEVEPQRLKFLSLPVYSIISVENIQFEEDFHKGITSQSISSIYSVRAWLTNNFICTAPYTTIKLQEYNYLTQLEVIFSELNDNFWPADGLVLTESLRTQGNQVIPAAQAFKFGAESGITTVKNIEWNLTKTRYLMPKLNVEPLFLSGTNVENATGYNAQWVRDNNIGIETKIEISKHGEIIPNVDRIISATGAELPDTCPVCGEELVWNGVHLQCPNISCGNAEIQDLLVWLENLAPIDNLGDKLKIKYITEWFGEDCLSIPKLMSALNGWEGFTFAGGRSDIRAHKQLVYDMLCDLYNKEFRLVDVIKALNIPRFGDVNAQKLAEYPEVIRGIYSANQLLYGEQANLLDLDTRDMQYQLMIDMLDDESRSKIGDANMTSLLKHAYKLDNLKYIWTRIDFSKPAEITQNIYKGKVAITGKLSVKRSDFEAELKAAGYEPKEISKDTKFLITDNPNSDSSKNKKADQWGIVKITEEEFRKEYL